MGRRLASPMRVFLLCVVVAGQALAPSLHRLLLHEHGPATRAVDASATAAAVHAVGDHESQAPSSPARPVHDDRTCAFCTLASVALPAVPPGPVVPALRAGEAPLSIQVAAPQTFSWPAALIRGPPSLQVI